MKWAVTQYKSRDMTEASWCIYIYIYIYAHTNVSIPGPATNHCPENVLNHMCVIEHPNDHKTSPSSVLHLTSTHNSTGYATECWLIATKLYVSTQVKSDTRELLTMMNILVVSSPILSGPLLIDWLHLYVYKGELFSASEP